MAASQSFADRLIAQLLLAEQRDDELLGENRALAQNTAEKVSLLEKNQVCKDRIGVLENSRNEVTTTNKAARKRLLEVIADDERQRKVLSEELQVKIQEMNVYAENCAKLHTNKVREGATLKEQLAVLSKHKEMGSEKFREITETREKEISEMRSNITKEVERLPTLRIQNEEMGVKIAETREVHTDLKGQVDTYIRKFNDVQQRLNEARTIYDAAVEERDRMARRLHTAETDRQAALSRAEKSKAEMLTERVKVEELEKQVLLVEKQTQKLQQLYDTFSNKTTSTSAVSTPAAAAAEAPASHVDPNAQ